MRLCVEVGAAVLDAGVTLRRTTGSLATSLRRRTLPTLVLEEPRGAALDLVVVGMVAIVEGIVVGVQ